MENIERINSVQYELYSQKFGIQVIQEPRGWNNDTESFERDKNSRGITSKIDVDLEFFGNAADYITNVYNTLGIQEKVILTKYEKSKTSLSEEWTIKYIQELDLGNYKVISRTGNVSVSSREGGLFSDIKNRESDKYDLLNNLSADEVDLGDLKTEVFQPLGKKLFVESKMEGGYTGYRINGFPHKALSSTSDETSRPIPLEITYSSNLKDLQPPFNSNVTSNLKTPHTLSYEVGEQLPIGDLFFFRAEQDNISLSLKLDLLYKITLIQIKQSSIQNFSLNIIKTNRVGEQDLIKSVTELMTFTDFTLNVDHSYNDTFYVDLLKDESLSLVFTFKSFYGGGGGRGYVNFYLNILKNVLIIQDTTAYEENVTISKCIKPLVFFDRLVAKITGKNGLVKSSLFEKKSDGTDGDYENIVLDNGLWARGFPDSYTDSSEEEQKIQLTSSFKEAFESFNYLEPLCWYTEIVGSTEYIRIEKATYTQQNFIGIQLGSVDKIEYESSSVDYFSKVEIGQKNSLEYEGLNGLDETNGKSEFSTFITNNKPSIYAVNSDFRTDSTGYELTRRLPFLLYPKEDTKRDDHIWMHDAKVLTSGVITHKTWQDRFDTKPIGVYDADSSWNLWLSPINRLYYGHSYSVQIGLYHYPNKKITFNSSNSNQNLITQNNGIVLAESGSLTIGSLPQARVEATKINFTFKMTQKIDNMFKGRTEVNSKDVLNYFGLIEYIENGVKKYGRLVKLESSEEAKITLIKARL
tara:strand:- start:1567 stop:3816 length:2250 start_codon:yes stop_codon:yes gene_type:complete